jgi:hypothetical protein
MEVSSSNFPRFDRNLNTGGKNYDETQGVVARNAVHHSQTVSVGGQADGGEEILSLDQVGAGVSQGLTGEMRLWLTR